MVGKNVENIVKEAFPGDHRRNVHYQTLTLRWILRGLAFDLAIKKVKFDMLNKKTSYKKTKNTTTVKKKTKSESKGAKHYFNRKTFAL